MVKNLKDNTILVIDDDPDLRTFASVLLQLEGYNVLQAGTGSEALKMLGGLRVSLILLDLKLPDISGWSILEQVKNTPAISAIPVIIFTASVEVSQHERALALGAADYLTKPLSAAELKGTVDRILKSDG